MENLAKPPSLPPLTPFCPLALKPYLLTFWHGATTPLAPQTFLLPLLHLSSSSFSIPYLILASSSFSYRLRFTFADGQRLRAARGWNVLMKRWRRGWRDTGVRVDVVGEDGGGLQTRGTATSATGYWTLLYMPGPILPSEKDERATRWSKTTRCIHARLLLCTLSMYVQYLDSYLSCALGFFSLLSLIRNHCMSRGSNEIAAIKMMRVYMPRVLRFPPGYISLSMSCICVHRSELLGLFAFFTSGTSLRIFRSCL